MEHCLCDLTVTDVIVYRSFAMVTRRCEMPAVSFLKDQDFKLTLRGFQADVTDREHVMVKIDSDTIDAVTLEHIMQDSVEPERDQSVRIHLQNQIQVIEREITVLKQRIQETTAQESPTFSLPNRKCNSGVGLNYLLDEKSWKQLECTLSNYNDGAETQQSYNSSLLTQSLELEHKLKSLQESLNKFDLESVDQKKNLFDLSVLLHVGPKGPLKDSVVVSVEYIVYNCSWVPSYHINLVKSETDASKIDLNIEYFGNIKQETGEDWKNVPHISLCTNDVSLSSGPSVDQMPEQLLFFTIPPKSFFSKVFSIFSRHKSTKKTSYVKEQINVVKNLNPSAVYMFRVPGQNINIKSDGKVHPVVVKVSELKNCYTENVIVPKLSQNSYLKVECPENTLTAPMIPGAIKILDNKQYVCDSSLGYSINPGDLFSMFVGINPDVKVQYLPVVKKEKRSDGMFSSHKEIYVERATVLSNLKSSSITVSVVDQLPHSESDEIKVTLTEPVELVKSINKGKANDVREDGLPFLNKENNVEWRKLKIPSNGKVTLRLIYTIKHSSSNELDYTDL
ncbi:hypothetical protein AKO1_007588 [Acrasis kona]|uniref:DUF4139 domain-containing protein n=1 Tax=Acrasis kona TaxID=1008807 RepID=A0AAW2YTA3_9EUKA